MLVISRKVGESLRIGDDVEIMVSEISGGRVRIAIQAPKDVVVLRKEVYETNLLNQEAAHQQATSGTTLSNFAAALKEKAIK